MLDKPLSLGSPSQLGHLGEATFSIQCSIPSLGKQMIVKAKVRAQEGPIPG